MTTRPSQEATDVLIVGAGPTGLTLALSLAEAGVRCTLVERDARPQQHPAALILDTRTMEILRHIGVEADILGSSQNVFERADIRWVTSLAGRELGQLSALPEDVDATLALSPSHTVIFSQNRLEPLLWQRVGANPAIEFRRSSECRAIDQDGDGVAATFEDRGSGKPEMLRARYLVGCDGASSRVREALDLRLEGPVLQNMLGLHFTADLGEYVNHRKSILYWVLNRELFGVLLAHWLPDEWVLLAPYFPPQQKPEDFDAERCLGLIRAAIGTRAVPDLVLRAAAPWALTAKLANRYRRGRAFLAGDAAHCFPPTGGLGLNTGVQDAHNLAWMQAALLRGAAAPELLASYESERRPVGKRNLEHSVDNYQKMNELSTLAGFDFAHFDMLRAIQTSAPFARLPGSWQRRLVERAVGLGLGRLARFEAGGRRGERLRHAFRARVPGQSHHYRFLGLDLGFDYRRGALVPEPTPKPEALDPVSDYLPTTWPGARLPHLWLTRGPERLSLHDLLRADRFLLVSHAPAGRAWREASDAANEAFAMPIEAVSIGAGGGADLVDAEGRWPRLSEVEETGAVLVRPDGHVAWRARTLPGEPAGVLVSVLTSLGVIQRPAIRPEAETKPS